jgi:hypothetical protein
MPESCLSNFDAAKWAYNYGAAPKSETELNFWNSNDKEFVPTVWTSVNILAEDDFSYVQRCYFHEIYLPTNPSNSMYGSPICNGATELIQQLAYTAQRLDTPMRYIMGYNEPWVKGSTPEIDPVLYADYVFTHMATAARAHNLQLVSPTTKGDAVDWFARFVSTLHNNYPDDLALMTRIDLHYYKTQSSKWDDGADPVETFISSFPDAMVALGNTAGRGRVYWTWWANQQKYWITEHSNEQNNAFPQVSQDDTCRRISGQIPSTHGVGSIVKLNEDTRVERWAWWTTHRQALGTQADGYNYAEFHKLCNDDGTITATGRALLHPYADLDCSLVPPPGPPPQPSPPPPSPPPVAPSACTELYDFAIGHTDFEQKWPNREYCWATSSLATCPTIFRWLSSSSIEPCQVNAAGTACEAGTPINCPASPAPPPAPPPPDLFVQINDCLDPTIDGCTNPEEDPLERYTTYVWVGVPTLLHFAGNHSLTDPNANFVYWAMENGSCTLTSLYPPTRSAFLSSSKQMTVEFATPGTYVLCLQDSTTGEMTGHSHVTIVTRHSPPSAPPPSLPPTRCVIGPSA